jgi:transposase
MRGTEPRQSSMFAMVSLDAMVPEKHPIRAIKPLVDDALRELSPVFDGMYAKTGRPSIPPEWLLKSMLLIALFSVRSETQFCEQLRYNMLFRWFLDMDLNERPFDPTGFTHNRERLMEHDVGARFFRKVVDQARAKGLLSPEHFSVDGTLIEAWASMKSFRPKDDDSGDNNGFGDFKGTKRSNETHESKTDPDAKLIRKGHGKEAKLAFMGHALMENRNGLVVDWMTTEANGHAERNAAVEMTANERERRARRRPRRITVGADAGYAAREFLDRMRKLRATPHVAQGQHKPLDARTTRHAGYAVSVRARRLIEKVFGWLKTVGGLRRSRYKGREPTGLYASFAVSAYNLLRMCQLTPQPA